MYSKYLQIHVLYMYLLLQNKGITLDLYLQCTCTCTCTNVLLTLNLRIRTTAHVPVYYINYLKLKTRRWVGHWMATRLMVTLHYQ